MTLKKMASKVGEEKTTSVYKDWKMFNASLVEQGKEAIPFDAFYSKYAQGPLQRERIESGGTMGAFKKEFGKSGGVKPQIAADSKHPLSGQRPGKYKVNGKIISWDGTKEI
jgi:hypothetical protein